MNGGRTPDGDETRSWVNRSPRALTALEQDLEPRFAEASIRCFAETGAWIVSLDRVAVVDGRLYARMPDAPQEEIDARRQRHAEKAEAWRAKGLDMWRGEIEPDVERRLSALRRRRPKRDDIRKLVDHVERAAANCAEINHDLHWRMATSFKGGFPKVFAELTGRPEGEAGELLQGLDHRTSRMLRRLRGLARMRQQNDPGFDEAFAALLKDHGRRTGQGYGSAANFFTATWSMTPELPLALVDLYAQQDLDELDRREAAAKKARQRAVARVRRQVAAEHRERFEAAYRTAVDETKAMENHNHLMEQETTGLLREAIDRLANKLVDIGAIDQVDDVFHLSLADLRGDPGVMRETVARNRAEHARLSELEVAPFLGAPPQWSPPPSTGSEMGFAMGGGMVDGVLTGSPGSPGRVTGVAVVAAETPEPPDVAAGSVLVCRDAGPGWTPIFPILAAVVLDDGAVFQHAALLAREVGIPCVVGTRQGTKVITDGQVVTVDGTAGRVELT